MSPDDRTGPVQDQSGFICEISARFPIWEKVKDPGNEFLRQVRETKQTWWNTKNYNFRAYQYDNASDSLLTDRCLPFTQTTLVEILHINIKL